MIFRNSFKGCSASVPQPVYLEQNTNIVDDNGVSRCVVGSVLASESKIPSPDDYSLQTLLSAGVPLNRLNTVIVDSVPTSEQVENVVNNVINNSDKHE